MRTRLQRVALASERCDQPSDLEDRVKSRNGQPKAVAGCNCAQTVVDVTDHQRVRRRAQTHPAEVTNPISPNTKLDGSGTAV
jgi:hypothetical protein